MGIPESILFRDEEDALRIFRIGMMCEPPPALESVALSNSLINSAPLIAGVNDPPGRRKLANYVFRVSRALIGPSLANQLMYPYYPTFGVLPGSGCRTATTVSWVGCFPAVSGTTISWLPCLTFRFSTVTASPT